MCAQCAVFSNKIKPLKINTVIAIQVAEPWPKVHPVGTAPTSTPHVNE